MLIRAYTFPISQNKHKNKAMQTNTAFRAGWIWRKGQRHDMECLTAQFQNIG